MFSRSPPSGSGRREALASGNLPNVLQDGRRPQSAGVRPWRQSRVLEGPPIKLSNGLARTKAEPISMPATPTIPVSSIRVRCANGNSVEVRHARDADRARRAAELRFSRHYGMDWRMRADVEEVQAVVRG